jgi:hypothetical protein
MTFDRINLSSNSDDSQQRSVLDEARAKFGDQVVQMKYGEGIGDMVNNVVKMSRESAVNLFLPVSSNAFLNRDQTADDLYA